MSSNITKGDLEKPLKLSLDTYLSKDYANAEAEKLWAKVWQHVGRVEEIPDVGDFLTYDIGDESILVVRSAADSIKAFYNVCSHRGRQLVDAPPGAHSCTGKGRTRFRCSYHGWQYDLDGKCDFEHLLDKDDWGGAMTDKRTRLGEIKVDTWGGWIWINMDPNAESLRSYLEPMASYLDVFELHKMRYRWRRWVVFECNWKVAIEAFAESYHVKATHPQLNKYGDFYALSVAQGKHGNNHFHSKKQDDNSTASKTVTRVGTGDARKTVLQMQTEFWDTMRASTTPVFVEAAKEIQKLPQDTPAEQVYKTWKETARRLYAERGVTLPELDPKKVADAGLAWQVFPNMTILQGDAFALCYRTRPYGTDPDKCIYEAFAIEQFPEGFEPETEWVYTDAQDKQAWGKVLSQDFSNMRAVQRGMKSRGFRGPLPNPIQERKVTNLHRNLAQYMGSGAPHVLSDDE